MADFGFSCLVLPADDNVVPDGGLFVNEGGLYWITFKSDN
jgi:hypothetical protein